MRNCTQSGGRGEQWCMWEVVGPAVMRTSRRIDIDTAARLLCVLAMGGNTQVAQ